MYFSISKIVAGCLFALVLPLSSLAAPDLLTGKRAPVHVTADRLEADDNSKLLVFFGNAVATQDDFKIQGDRLTVQYAGEQRTIERVIAEGHVRIVQGERVATGDKAVFHQLEGRIVLTGSPKVVQGDNYVQGQEITLYLDDQRSVVSGGSGGRVNAVFTPQPEGKP